MNSPFFPQAQSIEPRSLYEHYKGQRYKVFHVARHTETLEEVVEVYQALYGAHEYWVRPVSMFRRNHLQRRQATPLQKNLNEWD